MTTAVTRAGGIDFELIEPGEGPSPYKEFLEQKGEGLHHVMCRRQDDDNGEVMAALRSSGLPELMAGRVAETGEYAYFDAQEELKLIVEAMKGRVRPTRVYPPDDAPAR